MTGRPTAAPAHFPYDHPNMAVVMVVEAYRERIAKESDRARYERERRSARG